MPKPLVSAIIPTRNHAHVLNHALDSIYAQERLGEQFAIEVIVVDDASSDEPAEVVFRYPEARYLRMPEHRGVSTAQNEGIRASCGEFISFLAADDTWLPHKLRLQVPKMLAHPAIGVVYSQTLRRCNGSEHLYPEPSRAPSGQVFEAMLAYSFAGHLASDLIRREALDRVGYFDESLQSYEDYDLTLRLAYRFPYLFEPGAVSVYNLSPNGLWLSRAVSGGGSKDYARALDKALRMLPDSERSRQLRADADIRIAFDAATPFVLVGDLARAWERIMTALRRYPACGEAGGARGYVVWVATRKLLAAASPVNEARQVCSQIKAATDKGGSAARGLAQKMMAEIWSYLLDSRELRSRLGSPQAMYAAARLIACEAGPAGIGKLRSAYYHMQKAFP